MNLLQLFEIFFIIWTLAWYAVFVIVVKHFGAKFVINGVIEMVKEEIQKPLSVLPRNRRV